MRRIHPTWMPLRATSCRCSPPFLAKSGADGGVWTVIPQLAHHSQHHRGWNYKKPSNRTRAGDWIAKVKPFACQRGVKRPADGAEGDEAKEGGAELPGAGRDVNQFVIEELTKLQQIYSDTGDHWRCAIVMCL